MDHNCCSDVQDRGHCRACLPEGGRGCNVLVKLGDMGVSVNPAAHNHDALGVKRFAPEASNTKLTEKVSSDLLWVWFNGCGLGRYILFGSWTL